MHRLDEWRNSTDEIFPIDHVKVDENADLLDVVCETNLVQHFGGSEMRDVK